MQWRSQSPNLGVAKGRGRRKFGRCFEKNNHVVIYDIFTSYFFSLYKPVPSLLTPFVTGEGEGEGEMVF